MERALKHRFREGDLGAFELIAGRYMRRAFHVALGITGNVEDARDLSQEAFLKAFQSCRMFDEERPFLPWFYRILRNLCFDRLRSRQGRWEEGGEVLMDLRSAERDPSDRLETEELKARVWAAIGRLSPDHREIIVLRHFEDLSYAEISEVLGIRRGTVMSRLYHARKELRRRLAPSSAEPGGGDDHHAV